MRMRVRSSFLRALDVGKDQESHFIWLTIYSDLITNLMMLFLCLYGLTFLGEDAFLEAMESFRHGFYPRRSAPVDQPPINAMQALSQSIRGSGAFRKAQVSISEQQIRLRIADEVLFKPSTDRLTPDAQRVLTTLAELLRMLPYTLLVEGHSDNQPVRSGRRYRSNWELSAARAASVASYLAGTAGIRKERLSIAAYGEYRPRAPNDSPANRSLNRRVELAIMRYE